MIRSFIFSIACVVAAVPGGCTTVTPFTLENQTDRGCEAVIHRGNNPHWAAIFDFSRREEPRTYHVVVLAGERWDSKRAREHELRPRRGLGGWSFSIRPLPGTTGVPGAWSGVEFVPPKKEKGKEQGVWRTFVLRGWEGDVPIVVVRDEAGEEVAGTTRTIPQEHAPKP